MAITKEEIISQKLDREGKIYKTIYDEKIKIINYLGYKRVLVEFLDEFHYQTWVNYDAILKGKIRNPFRKNKYGGIRGEKELSRHYKHEFDIWWGILRRINEHDKFPLYKDVEICEEWYIFKNFIEWLKTQSNYKYLKENNIRFEVDKDIKINNNKLYSPNSCYVVPNYINSMVESKKSMFKGGKYPIGITVDKRQKNIIYIARVSEYGKKVEVGRSKVLREAMYMYKKEKERYVKERATKAYENNHITKECYDSLMNWRVVDNEIY